MRDTRYYQMNRIYQLLLDINRRVAAMNDRVNFMIDIMSHQRTQSEQAAACDDPPPLAIRSDHHVT